MTEPLAPGTYYLHIPPGRSGPLGFLSSLGSLSRKSAAADERAQALIRTSSKAIRDEGAAELGGSWGSSPATYNLGGGGAVAVVHFGMISGACGLQRVEPSVAYDPTRQLICVFSGHLSNLDELLERQADSPTAVARIAAPGQLAAEAIASLYRRQEKERGGGDLLVLLSELQGQYAFTLYDAERRQVFAARDGSGALPLFYEVDEDGGVNLSSARLALPAAVGPVHWAELPPGHFLAGRGSPKLQQFALTPHQLSVRESLERSLDEELSPRASGSSIFQQDSRRSLSSEDAVFTF